MARDFSFDDSNLQKLLKSLSPKERRRELRNTFRRVANTVRKQAVANLRQSIRSDKDLEKGVRSLVYKNKAAGFRITVGTKKKRRNGTGKEYGFHLNRKNLKKPVLIWAEDGTKTRTSEKKTRYRVNGVWYTGQNRGVMQRYGFMNKTKKMAQGYVTDTLHKEVVKTVKKIAKKYGCT